MRLQPILDRLRSQTRSFVHVDFARSDEPLGELTDFPSLYLFPASEEEVSDAPRSIDNATFEMRDGLFSVMIAAKIVGIDDIEDLRDEVLSAIDGYVVDASHSCAIWRSGSMLQMRGTVWWWQDYFSMGRAS